MSSPPNTVTCAASTLVEAYERLRSDGTGALVSGLRGLGILFREGMAAWIRACAVAAPPIAAASTAETTATPAPALVPMGLEREVIDVLATMALTAVREVRT